MIEERRVYDEDYFGVGLLTALILWAIWGLFTSHDFRCVVGIVLGMVTLLFAIWGLGWLVVHTLHYFGRSQDADEDE